MAGSGYVLLYDRDCGICDAMSRGIRVADLRRRIRVVTIQSSRGLLGGIPDEHVLDAFHMVAPDGRVTTGGDAVPTLIEAIPMGAGLARALRGSAPLMTAVHRLYGFLTRFRDRLVCRRDGSATSAGSSP